MIRKILQISLIVAFCLLSNSANSQEISKVTVKEYIVKHSLELGVDPALALSIAKLESNFTHGKKAGSGAVGVFQIMPDTARRMGFNPYYLSDNIKGGLNYYKMMHQKFGSVELALAAYNAGPGNVARYGGVPPFSETKAFINRIQQEYKYQKANPDPVISQVKNKHVAAAKKTVAQPKPVSNVKPVSTVKPAINNNKTPVAVKKTTVAPGTPAVKPITPATVVTPAKKVAPVGNVSYLQPTVKKTVILNPVNSQFQVISTPIKPEEGLIQQDSKPKIELGDATVAPTPTTS